MVSAVREVSLRYSTSDHHGTSSFMTSAKPKPYRAWVFFGWFLAVYSFIYGLLQISATYVSPSDMKDSWLACMDRLGYPNNQPTSNCGTYEDAMSFMHGELTEGLLMIGFFLALSAFFLVVGYRRKRAINR